MKTNCWLTNKPIAHRGLFDNQTLPENSLAAFDNAVKHGFAIELDVQMTKDGVLVVFHDDTLDRMTNATGVVEKMDYNQIKDITLLDTDCKIPTFKQILELVDGKTELLIEIKPYNNVGCVEEKVAELLDGYKGDFAIESFNPLILRWFKKHRPNFVCGQLASECNGIPIPKFQKFVIKHMVLCRFCGCKFVAYNVNDIAKVKRVQRLRKKMPVLGWTVCSQNHYEQTKQHYDNMIFDSFVPLKENN